MLLLDGVYVENDYGGLRFHRAKAPSAAELKALVHAISHRVARFLEKRGCLECDADDCKDAGGRATQEQLPRTSIWRWNRMTTTRWCNSKAIDVKGFTNAAGAWMRLERPITYRIAVGPQLGRKVFTVQTLPPDEDDSDRVAEGAGFSLHAGVSAEAHQRDKLQRFCCYVSRPAVPEMRLALTSNGNVSFGAQPPEFVTI